MYILGIDTSSRVGGVALLEDGRLQGSVQLNSAGTHSERLLPSIDFLLAEARVKLEQIEAFAVIAGPGSFTGLRIGLSTVKGLSFALGASVIALSSLETLAFAIRGRADKLWPVLDAQRGEVFTAVYASPGPDEIPRRLTEEILAAPQQAFLLFDEPNVAVAGSGVERYLSVFRAVYPHPFHFVETEGFLAADAAKLGHIYFMHGTSSSPEAFDANYIRPSGAERKRKDHT